MKKPFDVLAEGLIQFRSIPRQAQRDPWLYGLASRKSFTIGTMTGMRCISVTWVVLGKMANRDAERGFMSPWISPPFRQNISATYSSRTPSASPWMKNIGAVVPLSLSAPMSDLFEPEARSRLTNVGNRPSRARSPRRGCGGQDVRMCVYNAPAQCNQWMACGASTCVNPVLL